MREIQDVGLSLSGSGQHDRSCAIAEEHTRRPIGVIDDARHHVGADHEYMIVRSGGDHLHAGRQRIGEPRARRAEIESPGVTGSDFVLEHARRARKYRVGSRRADDDEPDLIRRDAGLAHGADRRFLRQIGRRDAIVDDMALPDARSLKNPFVARFHHFFQIRVRQHFRRNIGGQSGNLHGPERLHHRRSFPGASSPKYAYALAVATRPRGVRSRNPI